MADVVNLNRVRKAKARVDKAMVAAQNRVAFGRTKLEKQKAAAERRIAENLIDAHKRATLNQPATETTMPKLTDFSATRLLGGPEPLADFAGKVALVVNVASQCGNTPQYEGLEALYRQYGPQGFVVLGFPCNQFKGQEPGTAEEIAEFCTVNFGVDFPMFGKVEVNGPGADPLFRWLKRDTPGSDDRDVEWNFAKFLVGRDGLPVKRFGDKFLPEGIAPDIEALL